MIEKRIVFNATTGETTIEEVEVCLLYTSNPKAKEIYKCADCGYGIFLGDAYYEINDVFICEDCMEQYKKECEEE